MQQSWIVGPTPKSKTVGSQNITISGTVASGGLIAVTATAHGLETGDIVQISGVTGTLEADGQWVITKTSANAFTLNNSTFANAYVSGGAAAHVGYASAALDVDNTVFAAVPTNLTAVVKMHSAPVNVTCRVVLQDSWDAAFLTAMPAFTGGFAGGVTPANDCRIDWRYEDEPDARLANSGNNLRLLILWGRPVAGSVFQFSSWVEN